MPAPLDSIQSAGLQFPNYGATTGTGTNGLGLAPGQGMGAYGGVPTVPNPINTATSAIGGNIGNLGGITSLTGGLGAANASAAQSAVGAGLPGYAGLLGQASGNIASDLAGQVNPDVWQQIQQGGAERGVATGSPGSPNANAAMLRALGLTSMGLQSQGQQELSAAVARTPTGPPVDASRFAVTPDQMQEASYMQSLFNAAPNPTLKANAEMDALMKQISAGQGAAGGGSTRPWAGYGGTNITGSRGGSGPTDALGFPTDNFMAASDYGGGPTMSWTGPGAGAAATPPGAFDYNSWMKSLPGQQTEFMGANTNDPEAASSTPGYYAGSQFPDYSGDYGE